MLERLQSFVLLLLSSFFFVPFIIIVLFPRASTKDLQQRCRNRQKGKPENWEVATCNPPLEPTRNLNKSTSPRQTTSRHRGTSKDSTCFLAPEEIACRDRNSNLAFSPHTETMVTTRRSRALCSAITACHLVTSAVADANSVSISISSDSVPSGTSQYVDIGFGGFGIEPSNLFSFAGQENQNDLSINLLQNLANYTGKFAPH